MTLFSETIVSNSPLSYYVLISPHKTNDDWRKILPLITEDFVYFPQGKAAIYSSIYVNEQENKEDFFELICLSCFYQIMRATIKLRSSVIDNQFEVLIKPWRTPCETTALFTDLDGQIYYLEGCREYGVFWRSKQQRPLTVPPFISCGAFDEIARCWGEECPHDYYVSDEEEPFVFNNEL
jgi:hypothetical protein